MLNKNKISSLLAVLAVFALSWYWFFGRDENYQWDTGLRTDEFEPYDLGIMYETLKEERKDHFTAISTRSSLRENRSLLLSQKNATYLFFGNRWFANAEEAKILREFMSDGGTVFLSVPGVSEQLMEELPVLKKLFTATFYDDSVNIGFTHEKLKDNNYGFSFLRENRKEEQAWFGFDFSFHRQDEMFSDKLVIVSRIINTGFADCIRISVGKGFLYLHHNPVLFSNLYLTTTAGQNYFSNILKHLSPGPFIYDHSGMVPRPGATSVSAKQSILSFIRSNEALKSAWILLVLGLLLFVFIGGRRRKKPTMPLYIAENNSMQLLETLGYLYSGGRKNNQLVFKRELIYFYDYCKNNFRMQPNSEESFQELSDKSGVPNAMTETIRKKIEKYRIFSELSDEELLDFSANIHQFYTEHRKQYGRK